MQDSSHLLLPASIPADHMQPTVRYHASKQMTQNYRDLMINDSNQSKAGCKLCEAQELQHPTTTQGNHTLGSAEAERISPSKIRHRADLFPSV